MDTTQLISSVIIAVIALLAKEVILWLLKLINPIIKKVAKTLAVTIISWTNRYFRILIDILELLFFSFIIRNALSDPSPITKSIIFNISFLTAMLVYWFFELLADINKELKKKQLAEQNAQPDSQ